MMQQLVTKSSTGKRSEDIRTNTDVLNLLCDHDLEHSNPVSTQKEVNQGSKDVTLTQQQKPESPTVILTWHASKYEVHKLHQSKFGSKQSLLQTIQYQQSRFDYNIYEDSN